MTNFAISRILGNELPPRDMENSKIQALEFILAYEPLFLNTKRIWILNQVLNTRLKNRYKEILTSNKEEFYELEFNREKYNKSETKKQKILNAININFARNYGFKICKDFSDYIFLLDGDCFFDKLAWNESIKIISDNPTYKYFGIPGIRITKEIPSDPYSQRMWEPTLVFRKDAELLYNENIAFGNSERIELLSKLGYKFTPQKFPELTGSLCKNAGYLYHISFSSTEIETNIQLRVQAREESLNNLILKIENIPL